jgi:hypothetical protein
VILKIDGKTVFSLSYKDMYDFGLHERGFYGVYMLGYHDYLTCSFGWPVPLTFRKSLDLSLYVKETGLAKVAANVIWGKSG